MEDAPTLLKIPKSECPDIWIRLPKHKWPKSWSSMEDPVVPLERNSYGHPLAGLIMGKAIRDSSIKTWLGKGSELGMLFCQSGKRTLPICVCGMKDVDLGEPTSFLNHVYLGCTQRECQNSNDILDNYRDIVFESRISARVRKTTDHSFRET